MISFQPDNMFICNICGNSFTEHFNLLIHQWAVHDNEKRKCGMFSCNICGSSFTVNKSLLRHQRTVHGNEKRKCTNCNIELNGVNSFCKHIKQQKTCEICGVVTC